jgi:8-oxo-dGTP diphosphatase
MRPARIMKHIHVACAIIEKNGKVLATQRGAAMSSPMKWEFPGGKIDDGESPEECLRREVGEEIGVTVNVVLALSPHTHRYDTFAVTLYPFVCTISSGQIILHEHAALRWLKPEELHTLDWVDADPPIIDAYREALKRMRT